MQLEFFLRRIGKVVCLLGNLAVISSVIYIYLHDDATVLPAVFAGALLFSGVCLEIGALALQCRKARDG